MKKLLALVLALVMTLGLATVSSSAAYADADSIEYEEAVDVMNAIGVIAGMDDGSFNPKGTLTREQGAKIITYMLMGGKTAGDALTASKAPFSDVAADRWSAGAIAYCANAGILAGVGDGKFDPTGALTGAAFAKMLLTALGYNAQTEGLVGADYMLNTVRLVNKIDLANGLGGLSYNGAITRDEAAKLAFNTLTEDVVEYTGGMSVTAGDVSVVQSVPASVVANNSYTYVSDGNGGGYEPDGATAWVAGTGALASEDGMQFCENYFPSLKVYSGADKYGHNINYWYLGNSRTDMTFDPDDAKLSAKGIVSDVTDTVVATLYKTSDVTYGDLYKLGDQNTTVIRTNRGRTIMVQHNTTNERPYSRINTIQGTKGILSDYPLRVALAPNSHSWMKDEDLAQLMKKYCHPLWDKSGEMAKKVGGHGGMDFLMDLRLCHCLTNGLPLDIDVYDSVLWSSLVPLTEQSVLKRGQSVDVPDFTRGAWRTAKPLGIVGV